jgi:hypothetical protein
MAVAERIDDLLEAALLSDSTVISHASELVQLLKIECEAYNDAQQTDIRSALTHVVRHAREATQANSPMDRCLTLGQLASSSNALLQALEGLSQQEPEVGSVPAVPSPYQRRPSVESTASIASSQSASASKNYPGSYSDSSDDEPEVELYNNMDELWAELPRKESVLPELPTEIKDVFDIIMRDVEELFGALERWDVAEIVCMTTGVIRALPTLLQAADKAGTPQSVLDAQKVGDSTGGLYLFSMTVA